jgi:17beta-estradiol 17-dehydrogenase / very-long-chain 3-oxoacyl-CoA reductase
LITGSSAGIGFGIAKHLVSKGFGVILLSNVEDELREAKATLQGLVSDVEVYCIHMDAITATAGEIAAAIKSIAHLRVSILFNNVGGAPIKPPAFRSLVTWSADDVSRIISLNSVFMVHITRLMLPLLKSTTRPGQRALIVNVSSGGRVGIPYIVLYGATKSFVTSFNEGLARELACQTETAHIDSLCLVPGDVQSQSNNEGSLTGGLGSDEYGQMVVQKVDAAVRLGWHEYSPYWVHAIQIFILECLPESIKTRALTQVGETKAKAFGERHKLKGY